MELSLERRPVAVNETVLDLNTEQAVETDFVLADYYPRISRILHCEVESSADQAVVSVQRRFGTMGGRQVLPQDLPLRRQPEISRFDLLACCALLLLCGWGDALTTLPL